MGTAQKPSAQLKVPWSFCGPLGGTWREKAFGGPACGPARNDTVLLRLEVGIEGKGDSL